ncbi:Ras GTPase activating protein ira2, partial [Rhizopus stolonifer]
QESNLFRRTSVATRLLSAYTKDQAQEYLRSVLTPVFQKIVDLPTSYELDPLKVPKSELEANRQNLISITELFVQAICQSSAPTSFREICRLISTAVLARFPHAKHAAVGSFLFLRFFCPAIVSPESFGLVKSPLPREIRRGLLLATKVIQNLANNVLFGAKETFMIVLNDFLTSHIYTVTSFLREMTLVSDESSMTYELNQNNYRLLHRVLTDHMEHLARDLTSQRLLHTHDPETMTKMKKKFDKFANTLAQLGNPTRESTEISNRFVTSNQLYEDFMRRNSERRMDLDELKSAFYEGGASKSGRPVFYLIMRHVQVNSIDLELLIYHILHTLEINGSRTFDVLIDFTLFSKDNDIPAQWLKQLLKLASQDLVDNTVNLYIYNPNTFLKYYLRKTQIRPTHKLQKRTFFAVTLADLQEHFQAIEIKLPDSTIGLETDPSVVFFPVYKIIQYKTNIPLAIKVSAEYVQIMTVHKQELAYRLHTVLNDVYHISEIEQATLVQNNSQNSEPANEFGFKTIRDSTIRIFSSPKREAIVNTIIKSQRRYESSRPTTLTERTIRPNDVPGRLLNMALLNMGSDDPDLRLSSYRLLYALTRAFNFNASRELLDTRDLCLPANSTEFIVGISEKIAVKEPLLTIEFLNECVVGYTKSKESTRYLILLYMLPWLPNLTLFCGNSAVNTAKVKDSLRQMIDLTVNGEMTKLIQAKIWKTISCVEGIIHLVIDTFLQVALEHGVGSRHAEVLADTLVTLTSVTIRLKLLSILRRVLVRTSFNPTRSLISHETWPEIAILVRFILMTSFNSQGPLKRHVPEVLNMVALLVATGPTLVRSSIHGIMVHMIQMLCTRIPLPANNIQRLQLILQELSESKWRLLFGLSPTLLEPISLISFDIIVTKLLDIMHLAAPNPDILHCWRARWMSLVTSTAFQFNPAIQPRALVILGHLGRQEMDDDLLYQILVALRGALAIFSPSEPQLVISLMMCLKNVVFHDSGYLLDLFWVAVALVQLDLPEVFEPALELLESVFGSLDEHGLFDQGVYEVLLEARKPLMDLTSEVGFEQDFSFAVVGVVMKGMRYRDIKSTLYRALWSFLEIERRKIGTSPLGYVVALLPMAAKNHELQALLMLAGLSVLGDLEEEKMYEGIFDRLDIMDDRTALFVISLLATMIHVADSESERLFIFGVLSEAAVSMPNVFAL